MATHFENLSSNSLYHFTNSLDNLVGILEKTFIPRYCLEMPNYYKKKSLNLNMAYPMVCFCDIPLSKVKRHIGVYGNYGIGLTKDWAIRNNISPVIYTRKNAKTSNTLENIINWFNSVKKELNDNEQIEFKKRYSELLMHIKPYYGSMVKNERIIKRRFYDEREWRWIPELNPKLFRSHLLFEEFNNPTSKLEENERISLFRKLKFSPNDIRYLILNSESEIDDFIQSLENTKMNFNDKTIKRLTTRIITREQIIKDF